MSDPTPKHLNRRRFLCSLALAGTALGTTRCVGAEKQLNKRWQPRLCLSSVMFTQLSLPDFCAKAEALGFTGIDLWAPFGECDHLEQARRMGAPAFLKLLRKHNLEVGAWTVYRSRQYKERFAGYADFIGACGGGVVVFGTTNKDAAEGTLDESFAEFFDSLIPEIELAKQHKVEFAVENHSYAILDSLESYEVFHRLNPDPAVVGLALAPYHLQAREVAITDAIEACRGQIRFFYAWQRGRGTGQLPGIGPADFTPWLKALKDDNFNHWMTPFMHGELPMPQMTEAVSQAKQYLEALEIQSSQETEWL